MNLAKAIVESRPKAFDRIMPRWATVTSATPLRIRFDGESDPLNLKPIDLAGVSLNDRVWTLSFARQVFLVGKLNGGMPAGSITAHAGTVIPAGWLRANGATYNTVDYPALAAALGATGSTFAVPNYAGRTLVGLDTAQTEFNALGKTGGAKTHTLSISEMPNHSHTLQDGKFFGDSSGEFLGNQSTGKWINQLNGQSTNGSGGGAAHNNLQPYAVVDWIIKT